MGKKGVLFNFSLTLGWLHQAVCDGPKGLQFGTPLKLVKQTTAGTDHDRGNPKKVFEMSSRTQGKGPVAKCNIQTDCIDKSILRTIMYAFLTWH